MNAARLIGWRHFTGLLLACSATLAAASAPTELRPFNATYSITAGTAEAQLQRLGDGRWSYQIRLRLNFLARLLDTPAETSQSLFSIQDGRVVSQQFTADDRDADKDQSLTFDWNRGRITGTFERKPVDLPLQPGMIDSQSAQIALMNELIAGRKPQQLMQVEKGKVREYTYTMEGNATLHTAVGDYATVIYRSTRTGSKKSTVFWCAPDLGYLPIKVERRDGRSTDWTMTVKTLDMGAALTQSGKSATPSAR